MLKATLLVSEWAFNKLVLKVSDKAAWLKWMEHYYSVSIGFIRPRVIIGRDDGNDTLPAGSEVRIYEINTDSEGNVTMYAFIVEDDPEGPLWLLIYDCYMNKLKKVSVIIRTESEEKEPEKL